jgi:hypothetical protein
MHTIFEDLIWIAQNDTHGNIQDIEVDLATSLMQALVAVLKSKKLDLQTFFSCSKK